MHGRQDEQDDAHRDDQIARNQGHFESFPVLHAKMPPPAEQDQPHRSGGECCKQREVWQGVVNMRGLQGYLSARSKIYIDL